MKIDFADDNKRDEDDLKTTSAVVNNNNNNNNFPSRKDCQLIIRQQITSCFGLIAEHVAIDTQGMMKIF